ncbi:MAG TPA: outer membrane beta-barrel domain-containing protein [Polyangia bacterium]|jgi:outer membrane beta-barrel protein|nr:outer membrane beta-barrel domain-containing protein [Polyangia bacterium]
MTMTNPMPSSMPRAASRRLALVACPLVALFVTLVPLAAQAQRKSPLEDAPAIRKRVELRETRFELGVGMASTITQDFYHTMLGGVKLAFHFNDWLSLAAFGSAAVANLETGFQSRIVETLPAAMDPAAPRDPTQAVAKASMQKIKALVGAQLEFAPFTGKYSLFGKIFAHYDFYIFGGAGLMQVAPTDPNGCVGTMSYCGQSGFKPGGNAGVGFHSFFNQWFALNVELRDFVARLDPSGRDVNGDGVANSADVTWTSTYLATANLMFFLPGTAAISP